MKVNACCPHVVRLDNLQAAQQVGVYLVPGRGFARAGARNQRFDPHHPHQPLHPLAVDPHQALADRSPMAVWREATAGVKAVDMMDNASALPTGPQPQQQTQPLAA